jgi:hypothetical protein
VNRNAHLVDQECVTLHACRKTIARLPSPPKRRTRSTLAVGAGKSCTRRQPAVFGSIATSVVESLLTVGSRGVTLAWSPLRMITLMFRLGACEWCATSYLTVIRHQKYCSVRCRQQAYYARMPYPTKVRRWYRQEIRRAAAELATYFAVGNYPTRLSGKVPHRLTIFPPHSGLQFQG